MSRTLFRSILAAACALAPLAATTAAPAAAQTVTAPSQRIDLAQGSGRLLTLPAAISDVFVADNAIADVEVKSRRQLYIMGRAGGETTVYASDSSGETVWSATIRVGSNIDSVAQMLSLAMPEARIGTTMLGTNTLLLTGVVAAPEDAAEAERLVAAYLGESVNVISRLRTATPLQVSLRVRFAEVSRSLVRALGVNLATIDGTGGLRAGIGQGRSSAFPQISPSMIDPTTGARVYPPLGVGVTEGPEGSNVVTSIDGGSTLAAFGRFLGLDFGAALDLAEREGLVTTLSEPNLTALSGETAEFLAGGEFPILLSQGLGTTTVEYKKYGVSLSYTPTVLSSGRISLRVRPEVSELSSQGAVSIDGVQIPALTVRRAETSVELGSGQSFMIAGLMSNSAQDTIERAPGLGELPILGNLFRSTEFRKGETELVIVVTPYLVEPVDDAEIRLPTDGFRSPTVADQLLLNRQEDGVSGAARPMPRAAEPAAPAAPQPFPRIQF